MRSYPCRVVSSFQELGVSPEVVAALGAVGITEPTPIQSSVIPDALAGRDVLGRAPTGSGKTFGFGIPLLQLVASAESRRPRGLVLAPTRELAVQIRRELTSVAVTNIARNRIRAEIRRPREQQLATFALESRLFADSDGTPPDAAVLNERISELVDRGGVETEPEQETS